MMEAVQAANAFLDLYDLVHEEIYLNQALGIARTYLNTQSEDGSWPVKVDFESGVPVNDVKAIPNMDIQTLVLLGKEHSIILKKRYVRLMIGMGNSRMLPYCLNRMII